MRGTIDPIKLLARRFASLPPLVRMKITEKLLRWREENQEAQAADTQYRSGSRGSKSMIEQFWDEVEAAHNDGLYPTNPFSGERSQLLPFALKDGSEQRCLAYN